MLLTQLQETINRKAKTTEELQKMLDVSSCIGLEAISATQVKPISKSVTISGIITPGTLPFTIADDEGVMETLMLILPTVASYEGSGLDKLEVKSLSIGVHIKNGTKVGPSERIPNKLKNLRGTPKTKTLSISDLASLQTLEGVQLEPGAAVEITNCPLLTSVADAVGLKELTLTGCPLIKFKNVPKTIERLSIAYNELKTGIPWFVTVPKGCTVKYSNMSAPDADYFYNSEIPLELQRKIIGMQERGGTKADILEIQQDLIDAGLDELAKL